MRHTLFPLLITLAGCSAGERPVENAPLPLTAEAPAAVAPPRLDGRWTIVAIDGRKPGPTAYDKPPSLVFTRSSYGGNAGCNDFGGLGLEHAGRWYGDFAMSNAMGCGEPLAGQDAVVHGLLASGPRIAWQGPDAVSLATDRHRVDLVRAGPAEARKQAPPLAPTGTLWSLGALDGTGLPSPDGRNAFATLALEGTTYRIETPCRIAQGGWGQEAIGTLQLEVPATVTRRPCTAAQEAPSAGLVEAVAGHRRYATGPNGELVLAGTEHWVVGQQIRRGAAEQEMIAGTWHVEGGPTAATRNGARPPEVRFAGRAYYLWDGCNHTEGLAILHERVLHSFGSGMSTLANCMAGRDDPKLKAVVTSTPSVGTLPGGGLLLRSAAGEVRLRRAGAASPDHTVSSRLGAPMRFTLLSGGGGTLELLSGNRFRLTQPCGITEGRWRAAPRETDGAYRFGPERAPDACMADEASRELQRAFIGNLDVAIGPNRDIALFVSRSGAVRARMDR